MKTLSTLLFALTCFTFCYAQSIHPSLISSGGAISFTGDTKVDWSVGELAVSQLNNSILVTEGFHQGEDISTAVFSFEKENLLTLFPNPTQGILQLKGPIDEIVSIEIFDPLGSIIMTLPMNEPLVSINQLKSGLYLVRCTFKDRQFEIHRIIKI